MNYDTVPVMLSGKDLDYLSDMFDWNSIACKKAYHYFNELQNEELKQLVEEIRKVHYDNLNKIIDTINNMGGSNE